MAAEDMKTVANWAKELGLPDKKLKEAIQVLGLSPDAKKGACAYFAKATIEKARKAIKA